MEFHSDADEPTSALVLKIVSGWSPSPPRLASASTLSWDGCSLRPQRVRIVNDHVEVEATSQSDLWDRAHHTDPSRSFLISFENGLDLQAEKSLFRSLSMGQQGSRATLAGYNWSAHRKGEGGAIITWVAQLEGDINLHGGNLSTRAFSEVGGHLTTDHLRLSGAYTYYLVWSRRAGNKVWHLLICTPDGRRPKRDLLLKDFIALQFVLGRCLRTSLVVGIGPDLSEVYWLGEQYGNQGNNSEPVIPLFFGKASWAPVLFEKISSSLRSAPDDRRLLSALSYYMESLDDHLDGRYLKRHVAVEAISRTILDAVETVPSFVDLKKWGKWLHDQESAIREMAEPDCEDELVRVLHAMPGGLHGPWSKTALRSVSVPLSAEQEAVLEEYEAVTTTGLFRSEVSDSIESGLRSNAILRTLLTALVARHVGYAGEIAGWEREPRRPYQPPPPDWWPVSEQEIEAASRPYHISGQAPGLHGVMWPEIEYPAVPTSGLVHLLAAFMQELDGKTNGAVAARVQPVPVEAGNDRCFDVKLVVAAHPSTQSLLFTVTESQDGLLVGGWDEDELSIKGETELVEFLRSVAESPSVIARIQRMMLIAGDMGST